MQVCGTAPGGSLKLPELAHVCGLGQSESIVHGALVAELGLGMKSKSAFPRVQSFCQMQTLNAAALAGSATDCTTNCAQLWSGGDCWDETPALATKGLVLVWMLNESVGSVLP
jgi:hypothetical protein